MSNIAIFVDYDNIYITLVKYYQKSKYETDLKTEIFTKIKQYFKYDNIITYKAFADFQKVSPVLRTLQRNQVDLRHVYSSNTRKNASDIAMAISVIKSIYSNRNIDQYVIVSSDSDILQIINELRYFGKDVFVIYSSYVSQEGFEEYFEINKYKTIESLLELPEYIPIIDSNLSNDTKIQKRLPEFMNVINDGIRKTFASHIHNGGGTAGRKDICDILYNDRTLDLVLNDISLIVDYLISKKILLETTSHIDPRYRKVLINEEFITKNHLKLNHPIIMESHYVKR